MKKNIIFQYRPVLRYISTSKEIQNIYQAHAQVENNFHHAAHKYLLLSNNYQLLLTNYTKTYVAQQTYTVVDKLNIENFFI